MKKRIFKTHDIVTISMLLAISVILGTFFTFRPVPMIKIPTKFFSVAVAGMLYGPIIGGLIGVLSDLLSFTLQGGIVDPCILVVEFLYGFTYGLILKKSDTTKKGLAKKFIYVLVQVVLLHVILTTFALAVSPWSPLQSWTFENLFIARIPGFIINIVLQLFGALTIASNSRMIRKIHGGKY